MPEMDLRQSGFTVRCLWTIYKKQKKKNTKIQRNSRLAKHDIANGGYKDLHRRSATDKVLCNKAFAIARNLHLTDINEDSPEWYTKFLNNKYRDATAQPETEIVSKD